jgi:hypothetical protein
MSTHPQDPYEIFPSWKPVVGILVIIIILLIGYRFMFADKPSGHNKSTVTSAASRFMGQYATTLQNGINLPPSYNKEARDITQARLASMFVQSHKQYFSTSTLGGPVSMFIIENTEFLFSHNNAQIILDKLNTFSIGKAKEVTISEINSNRTELVYIFGSRMGAVDFVTENGITKLDYLTPISSCHTRNETVRKATGISIPCNMYPKYMSEAAKQTPK